MWYPFSSEDATMRFRFVLRLDQPTGERPLPVWLPWTSVRGMGFLVLAFLVWFLGIKRGRTYAARKRQRLALLQQRSSSGSAGASV